MEPADKAKAFLEIAKQFNLGHLETEAFHPKTRDLSHIAKTDLASAHRLLCEIDMDAIHSILGKEDILWEMFQSIQNTLSSGNKVFMCGCGATGRLSLVLETLFRQKVKNNDQVFSFMAGGDYALIKSVESFEDKTEYGERQLLELGFGPNDLLIASTEGGETPFVIGAAEKAAILSNRSPYFLYCNPDHLLKPIDRSLKVLENSKIIKINLSVGPMAISGSTRMQASTVLMLGIGVCLLYQHPDKKNFHSFLKTFLSRFSQIDYSKLTPFTKLEGDLYREGTYLNYLADPFLGISILTDTTERSPTFSLKGFENRFDIDNSRALAYLFLSDFPSSQEAWEMLLQRPPRPVEWTELQGRIDGTKIFGFDISRAGFNSRVNALPTIDFKILFIDGMIQFECEKVSCSFETGHDQLFNHLVVKMLLNSHSTLLMGLLDRYEGNVMTWVRPSNNKLIDRAARYALQILKNKNKTPSYEEVVLKIFEVMENVKDNEAVVLKVVERF